MRHEFRLHGVIISLICVNSAVWAHGIVGQRMFIEPLVAEDANIKNELDLPRIELLPMTDGTVRTLDGSLEKTLWPDRWSVVEEQSRVYRRLAGTTVAAFDDMEVGTKLAAYRNEQHEFVLTPALFFTAPTGSQKLGDRHTAVQPALLFAKGLGDVHVGWLRPVAFQGDVGYNVSAMGRPERRVIYDMVMEYSLPYLNQFVRNADAGFDLEHNLRLGNSARAILGDLFPFVEFNASTPVAGTAHSTTSFLRPGVLYMGKFFQLGAAVDLPRGAGSSEQKAGCVILLDLFVILLDLFLDEIHPAFGWTPFGTHRRQHEDKD